MALYRLYSRRGCHLCERAEDVVAAILPGADVVDVDGAPDLLVRYGTRVPVLEADGVVVVEGRFDELELMRRLRDRG